jgi:hypothetical protein
MWWFLFWVATMVTSASMLRFLLLGDKELRERQLTEARRFAGYQDWLEREYQQARYEIDRIMRW